MATYTISSDASGNGLWVPPYTLSDGTYSVKARSVVDGIPGPYGAAVSLTMPNAAKTAALALIARMSVAPTSGRAAEVYALISALMTAGVWARLDLLCVLAAHDSQAACLNWVGPSYNLSAYNSPTFTTDRGFTGDGVAAYLEAAGYNPGAGGVNHALNNAAMGVWVRTPSSVGGIDVFTGNGRLSRRDTAGDDYHYRINDGTSTYGPGGSSAGLFAVDRPDAATKRRFLGGVATGDFAVASVANAAYLRLFSTGTGSFSNAEVAAVFAGASLTTVHHAALYAAVHAYLVTLGAAT